MVKNIQLTFAMVAIAAVGVLHAQDATQIAQERAEAERTVPRLAEVLELKPGMTVADVGSGGGAVTVVLGKWLGPSGRVFATDITESALRETREYAKREGLTNVTVLEGAAAATNLPAACCDAIFMRDVYHHITRARGLQQEPRRVAQTRRPSGGDRLSAAARLEGVPGREPQPRRPRHSAADRRVRGHQPPDSRM